MMSAISASSNGDKVILIEKNNILGKKLLITGKGRCNITSSLDINEFINNIPGNGKFLFSCFQNFTNKDIINMLRNNGLEVIRKLNVNIRNNTEVVEIGTKNGEVTCVYLDTRRNFASK